MAAERSMVMVTVVGVVVIMGLVSSQPFKQYNKRLSKRDVPATHLAVQKNTTRYGDSNVCKVCTTYTFNCNTTVLKPCPSNATDKGNTGRGERRDDRQSGKWNQWTDNDHKKLQNGSRPWNGVGSMCRIVEPATCTESACEIICCDGTEKETGTNSCKRRKNSDGTLTSCLNGGTLNSRGTHCTCPDDFIGMQCQHRKCARECQNGGQCKTNTTSAGGRQGDTTYNDDYCVCPSETSGEFCEKKKCDKECQNNGTCVIHSRWWSMCVCQPGYSGDKCEKKEKTGDCPAWSDLDSKDGCIYWARTFDCIHDEDCEGSKKCCINSCHERVCTQPANPNVTCTYNNETFGLGTVFYPDPCRICTCNDSHVRLLQGAIQCTRLMCPTLPANCKNVSTPKDACCAMCKDDMSPSMCADHYEKPYFANCPDGEVIIDVEPSSNVAKVNLTLQAKDCLGNALKVQLSDDRFQAGAGEENYHLMSAVTERDGRGNFAECVFRVRIRDLEPPKFLMCPMDFAESAELPVSWPLPVARDNVGLKTPPSSARHPGQSFPPGDHMIEYWTEDYEGNVARCSFVVTVLKKSSIISGDPSSQRRPIHEDTHHSPQGQQGSLEQAEVSSHSGLKVGGAIAGTSLVVLLVVFGFVFYRRYKRVQAAARGAAGPTVCMSSVNVGVVGGSGSESGWMSNMQPCYGMSPEEIMSPPMYSRMGDMMATGGGLPEAGELPVKTPLP